MASGIPIRNIYFLLCYAWNCLTEKDLVDVNTAGANELADLFARILITGVHRLRRRGLERGYVECQGEVAAVRGKIRLLETVGKFLDRHGRASCLFDELTVDTPQNRIVKSAMRRLHMAVGLDRHNRDQLGRLLREMGEVPDRPLNHSMFREVWLHANNRHYRFLIHVSRLILQCTFADERTGAYRFRDFSREGKEMANLFEQFLLNFLREERKDLSVGRENISWDASSKADPRFAYLPNMRTDITVRSKERMVVLEAKYYEQTLQRYYDRKTVHSSHLYQLMSYLRNLEKRGGQDSAAEGILIYPVTSDPLDITYEIQGHRVRIYTLNLDQDWRVIRKDMLALI